MKGLLSIVETKLQPPSDVAATLAVSPLEVFPALSALLQPVSANKVKAIKKTTLNPIIKLSPKQLFTIKNSYCNYTAAVYFFINYRTKKLILV
jgi:hypothetical protein